MIAPKWAGANPSAPVVDQQRDGEGTLKDFLNLIFAFKNTLKLKCLTENQNLLLKMQFYLIFSLFPLL